MRTADMGGGGLARRLLFLLLLLLVVAMLAVIARLALPLLWPVLRPALRLLARA